MNLIDSDKVKAYVEQINSFATNRSHAIRADGEDTTYFDGIREYAETMLKAIENGQFEPDKSSFEDIAKKETSQPKAKVRSNSLDTSFDAALDQTPEKTEKMYRMIYAILTKNGPLTDHEIRKVMTDLQFVHSWSGVSARRVELERAGWVRNTGEKRKSDSNSMATVWEAVPGA